MKTIKIKVTQFCIESGIKQDACDCPIAVACEIAGLDSPEVFEDKIQYYVNKNSKNQSGWVCTPQIIKFIEDFDNGLKVEPFEFEIEIEDE